MMDLDHPKAFSLVVRAVPDTIDKAALRPDMSLRKDLGLDSLGLASFLFRCADELGVDPNDFIEVAAGERLHTLGDVVAIGAKMMGENA